MRPAMSQEQRDEAAQRRREMGERLRLARVQAGYREQKAACEAHEWSYNTYKAKEAGYNAIQVDEAEQYAAAYGVSPSWLVFGSGPMTPIGQSPVIRQIVALADGLSEAQQRQLLGVAEGMAFSAASVAR